MVTTSSYFVNSPPETSRITGIFHEFHEGPIRAIRGIRGQVFGPLPLGNLALLDLGVSAALEIAHDLSGRAL
jgi:hypothetical protein